MPQFITIQDGSYSINIAHIATIEWHLRDDYADITVGTQEFTCEGEDLETLKKALGIKIAIAV